MKGAKRLKKIKAWENSKLGDLSHAKLPVSIYTKMNNLIKLNNNKSLMLLFV